MRTRSVMTLTLLLGLASAACGGEEPMPPMPEPAASADDTSGGDLESLDAEEAPAEAPADQQ